MSDNDTRPYSGPPVEGKFDHISSETLDEWIKDPMPHMWHQVEKEEMKRVLTRRQWAAPDPESMVKP